MCTVILGLGVAGPGTVALGAVRDERAERPSDPPTVLSERPRVVGGRDRVAGGTWLAVRERRAVVALLNRRPGVVDLARVWPRSRGRLALEVATAPAAAPEGLAALPVEPAEPLARAALAVAWAAVMRDPYAPFSLVFAAPVGSWLVGRDPAGEPHARLLSPGWHVLTHTELDDPDEPRAAWLMHSLAGVVPSGRAAAEAVLAERLRAHEDGHPAVCVHTGTMVTVSASLVWLAPDGAGYAHSEGRPCEQAFEDRSDLLAEAV